MKIFRTTLCALLAVVLMISGAALAVDKDTIVVVKSAEIISLDPQDITDTPSEDMNRKIYEGLVDFSPELSVVPKLAESWEVSEDGMTWTFKLRKGVKFHSGAPFNAEAVKLSFDRLLGGKFKRSSFFRPAIKEVRIIDEFTVAFDMKQPFGPFLNNLAHTAGLIIDPTYAADPVKAAKMKRNPSGTGPFKFAEWEAGDFVRLEANKDYWQGAPKLKNVVYKFVPEAASRAMMVETGEAQVAQSVNNADVERLTQNPDIDMRIFANVSVAAIIPNTTHPILKDARVRRALAYAIDRVSICEKILGGFAVPAYWNASPSVNCSGGQDYVIPYDPEQSKKLLEEAGWTNVGADGIRTNAAGERLSLELWTSSANGILPEAYLGFAKAVGMELKIVQMDWAAFMSSVAKPIDQNKSQLFMVGWSPSTGDADWVYRPLFSSAMWAPVGANRAFYKNDIVDENIAVGMRESDSKLRQAAYDKVEAQLMIDFPRIPIYCGKNLFAVRKEVKNLNILPLNFICVDHLTEIE